MRNILLLSGLLIGFFCTNAHTQPIESRQALQDSLNALIGEERFQNAFWGVMVMDLNTDEVLYRQHAEKSLIPASNTKLYTTAAALMRLGPEFRYRTALFADGPIVDGVLEGNLIIRGSGDPTIGGRFHDDDLTFTFRAWADSLRAHGITRITGDIIGDDDIFDDFVLGYGWSWDDEPFYYSAEMGGLVFNDNCVDFKIESGNIGEAPTIMWAPFNTDYITVENAAQTIHPDSSLIEGYTRPRGQNNFSISSQVPAGQQDTESLTISNPTLYFTHVFRQTLVDARLPVGGKAVDVDALSIKPEYQKSGMQRIAVYESPALPEIVSVINKDSHNLYADQLLKTISVYHPPEDYDGPGAHAPAIESNRQTIFALAGVDTSRIQLVDGSGLSRHNLVTPEMTTRLLRFMWHQAEPVREAFLNSLPIAGVDGSLEYRMRSGPAYQNVRAKTGFVSNARSLSGYVTAADGTPMAFSLMCNHYTIPTREVNAVQDAMLQYIARYKPVSASK